MFISQSLLIKYTKFSISRIKVKNSKEKVLTNKLKNKKNPMIHNCLLETIQSWTMTTCLMNNFPVASHTKSILKSNMERRKNGYSALPIEEQACIPKIKCKLLMTSHWYVCKVTNKCHWNLKSKRRLFKLSWLPNYGGTSTKSHMDIMEQRKQ